MLLLLTAEVGVLLELLLPVGLEVDGVLLSSFLVHLMSDSLRLYQKLLDVIGIETGQDREEIAAITTPTSGIVIRKIVSHPLQLQTFVIEVLDGDLRKLWWVTVAGVLRLKQLLLALEDLLEPGRDEHLLWRQVILPKNTK